MFFSNGKEQDKSVSNTHLSPINWQFLGLKETFLRDFPFPQAFILQCPLLINDGQGLRLRQQKLYAVSKKNNCDEVTNELNAKICRFRHLLPTKIAPIFLLRWPLERTPRLGKSAEKMSSVWFHHEKCTRNRRKGTKMTIGKNSAIGLILRAWNRQTSAKMTVGKSTETLSLAWFHHEKLTRKRQTGVNQPLKRSRKDY